MSLLQSLNWRYAVKRMNGQKVPQEKLEYILEAARLAPSSAGVQPYTVIVIENEALREKILPIAFNQPQILEASHLLVFAAWDGVSPLQIESYISHIAAERNVEVASLDGFKGMVMGLAQRTPEEQFVWTARQAYIAFGVAIAAAAEVEVDATPMEGFNAPALDELLGLKEKGLRSVTLLPLGYRDAANDWLSTLKKVRRAKKDFVLEIN